MEYVPVFRLVHTAGFFAGVNGSRVAYPPFGAVVFAGLYATGRPVAVYLALLLLGLAAAVWGVWRGLIAYRVGRARAWIFLGTILVTSFPIWGLAQRGNIELVVWGFCAAGVWAWWRGWDDVAGVLWGLAAGVKLYPVVLLVLLLPRGRWRSFGVGVDVGRGFAGLDGLAGAESKRGLARVRSERVWISRRACGRVGPP